MLCIYTGIATKNNLEKIMTSDFLCLEHESLVVWQTLFNYYTEELLVADKNQNFSSATQTKSTMKVPAINIFIHNLHIDKQW